MNYSHKSKINFFSTGVIFSFKNKKRIIKFIDYLLKNETKCSQSINYVFCNDKYLLKINREYLNHGNLTDIITFDLSSNKKEINGEIYISIERVKENSFLFGVSFTTELLRVIIHGALHLCSYNDKKIKEKRIMRKKEEYYLAQYSNF